MSIHYTWTAAGQIKGQQNRQLHSMDGQHRRHQNTIMTKKRQPNTNPQDKSNLLSILKNIERIYELCQDVLNTYAQTSLMLSLLMESQMLLLKLRVMFDRWHYHLPFKEACRVKFGDWSHKMAQMSSSFSDSRPAGAEPVSEYCPSKHFLLDLYSLLPDNEMPEGSSPYYLETSIARFIVSQDRIRDTITERWATYYKQRFSDYAVADIENEQISLLSLRKEQKSIRHACHRILKDISLELSFLNELQEPDIQPDQFARLADRVFAERDYGGRNARKSARQYVIAWRNKTPKRRLEQSRKDEIEASVKIIGGMKYGSRLAEYIGDELDIREHSEGVGQFLHHVRKDISIEELNDLIEQLYRIRFFREDKEQRDKAEIPQPDPVASVTTATGESRPAVTPQRPKLPYFFKKALYENGMAVSKYYDILHQSERYMNGRLTEAEKYRMEFKLYKKWKWNHLRVAFEKTGFINRNIPKKHFAEYIHQVFPYITVDSITRSIQRYNENDNGFDYIVREIATEFSEVTAMTV